MKQNINGDRLHTTKETKPSGEHGTQKNGPKKKEKREIEQQKGKAKATAFLLEICKHKNREQFGIVVHSRENKNPKTNSSMSVLQKKRYLVFNA